MSHPLTPIADRRPPGASVLQAAKAVDRIRRRLGSLDRSLTQMQALLERMRRQEEQLAVLRQSDLTAASRLDELEPVLTNAVASHMQAAVRAGTRVDVPVPHVVVPDVWPASVYEALIEAVPPPVFFDRRADGRRLMALPPQLAPLPAVVAWEWVARLLDHVLAAAIVRETLGLSADAIVPAHRWRARLLAREPGFSGELPETSPSGVTALLHFGPGGADDGQLVSRTDGASTTVPFRPNTLLAFDTATASYRYLDIASSSGGRHVCELGLEPLRRADGV